MKNRSSIPILPDELKPFWPRLHPVLTKVEWTPSRNAKKKFDTQSGSASSGFMFSSSLDSPQKEIATVIDAIKAITGDELLVNSIASTTLDALRTGFALGSHISDLFSKTSGLNHLLSLNRVHTLPVANEAEFHQKMQTCSAILLYTSAAYIVWKLGEVESEKVSSINVAFKEVPEVDLTNPIVATNCQLYYVGWYLGKSGIIRTPYEMLKVLIQYFEGLMAEIQTLNGSLKHTDSFVETTYQLAGTEFAISGFEKASGRITASGEFNRVDFASIVGNREAKHAAMQLAQRLACYDPLEKRNPFQVLGGLSWLRAGYGKAGTGKSLQIAATATLCHDLAEKRGIPFLFHPLPDTIISTFQGGSGERMAQWFESFRYSDRIIYAPIDDGENNFENRTRQGVSAGVREVIGVFLRHTEGAGAINHGNVAIDIMTNLPEQIDPAVMSRIQGRFPIDGAMSAVDFSDQDYLWWRKLRDINPKFIDVTPWPDREYLGQQGVLTNLLQLEQGEFVIDDDGIAKMVAEVRKKYPITDDRFFAHFYDKVKKEYPGFTSRDVRNIQTAINLRVMDFNVPLEWFENPALFFDHTFDHRVEMLREEMRKNMKGMSFSDLRYREAVSYIVRMSKVSDTEKQRQIAERVSALKIEMAARAQLDS
jgi:hypothetical protein